MNEFTSVDKSQTILYKADLITQNIWGNPKYLFKFLSNNLKYIHDVMNILNITEYVYMMAVYFSACFSLACQGIICF